MILRGCVALKRLIKLIVLLSLLAIFFSGCSFKTVDEMYRLPKRSEAFYDLQVVMDAARAGLDYCAPLAGEQRQTVQMADLDGDLEDEYLLFAKGTSNFPLRILIFDKSEDSYVHIDTIESSGSAFDVVEYVQMDEKPGMELVFGRQLNDQVIRSLSVYTFRDGQAQQLVSTNYSKFLTANLNGDKYSELIVIRPGDSLTDHGIVEMYSVEDSIMERSVEASMSAPVDNIKRLLVGKLHNGQTAVYVASSVGDSALVTDVYALVNDSFTNVTFSNESGTSVKTIRNYYVYAEDIDSDGVVELPCVIPMKQLPRVGASASDQYLIRWYAMTADGGEVDKRYTYHNFVGGWYLEVDSIISSRLTVAQRSSDFDFYLWDEAGEIADHLMTISVFTGQNRLEQSAANGLLPIFSTESVVYAVALEEFAEDYGITVQKLKDTFHLIRQDWKTGET